MGSGKGSQAHLSRTDLDPVRKQVQSEQPYLKKGCLLLLKSFKI
jgi:hypothetical protein